jgi:hypothetical protein
LSLNRRINPKPRVFVDVCERIRGFVGGEVKVLVVRCLSAVFAMALECLRSESMMVKVVVVVELTEAKETGSSSTFNAFLCFFLFYFFREIFLILFLFLS